MPLSFIKSSGNIITEDFCLSLANETKADYVKDRSFGAEMRKVDEVIASTFEKLRERWEENRTDIIGDELDTSELRNKWILPFLKALGYDPVFVGSNIKSQSGTEYHIPYKGWSSDYAPVIHMVHSSQDLDSKDPHSRTHKHKSPQDCLQQYINTSHHQWAMLTNGKKIRLLRDFYHSITKGFLEFDLESIFETANTEQFRVLFRILHRSRIENQYQGEQEVEYDEEGNPIETESNCLLESFHKKSRETGVKVGNKLRDQVIEAIEQLGNGFAENLNPDEFQNGKVKAFYAEILNVIYRLLFLMFAEQKGWLPVRNSIYARTYSVNALRELAEKGNYSHDEEKDLWEGLKITFKLVAKGYKFKNGEEINAFGGQLFSDKKIAGIKELTLKNKFLLDAIYRLSYFKLDNLSNRINYANLAIDELGSVYESLLDYEPKLARENTTVGKREVHRGEFYLDDRGTDRKTTGSYYTDSRLVAQLIESALVPVIENALRNKNTTADKEEALLQLKVADIACGSGAFLCAALEKLGEQLALIRMGDEERPTDEQLRDAKRDVLLHCIYGVDLNPMALELAKFSLWITASLPDMPLTFLDHKLKCGNSLIGATPELIEKGIPEEAFKAVGNDNAAICARLKADAKRHLKSLNAIAEPEVQYLSFGKREAEELLRKRKELEQRKQEEPDEVDLAEEEFHKLEEQERKYKAWLMADVWTAAFFIDKTEIDLELYPTNVTLEKLKENEKINEVLIDRVLKTAEKFKFFHYHLEFPEVFEKGGFDCLLGNPPWERIKLQEKEFFKNKSESVVKAKTKQLRRKAIEALAVNNPELYAEYEFQKRFNDTQTLFFTASGLYPYGSSGDVNTYPLFLERNLRIANSAGRVGILIPSGIATDNPYASFFQYLISKQKIVSLFDFENRGGKYFPTLHTKTKYCLFTASNSNNNIPVFAFYLNYIEDIFKTERIFTLSKDDFELLNPITKNCPIFRGRRDSDLVLQIFKKVPVLLHQVNEDEYAIDIFEMFHMSGDSDKFNTIDSIADKLEEYVPLYEGKMVNLYNHRYSNADFSEDEEAIRGVNTISTPTDLKDANYSIQPRFFVRREELSSKVLNEDVLIVSRKVSDVMNERTFIVCLIPRAAVGNSLQTIILKKNDQKVHFITNTSSFVFDYILRQKLGGKNIAQFVINQMPVIPFSWLNDLNAGSKSLYEYIEESFVNLFFNSVHLKEFFEELGYERPVIWDDGHRLHHKCLLDAIYAHLYGLEKEQLDYILETFPIVKRKDIDKYGSYRTKETILKLFDEFAWVKKEIAKKAEAQSLTKIAGVSS